jgi:hypothetical protein
MEMAKMLVDLSFRLTDKKWWFVICSSVYGIN